MGQPSPKLPPDRCDKCDGGLRYSFSCCGQTLCSDCFLDHAGENRRHEPPLSDMAMAEAAVTDTRDPKTAQLQKAAWLLSQFKPDDPLLLERMAKIDEIEFTICQKCGRSLRRFHTCEGTVLCTDCWLDHCGEIAGPPPRPLAKSSEQAPPPRKSIVREYAEALLVALVLAMFIRTFFLQAYKIPSGSMEPTLLIGDHILVNKIVYGLRMPESILGFRPPGVPYGRYLFNLKLVHRGDIVVFVFPPDRSKDFIKRVIAVGGDTVEVKGKAVYVNGERQVEPYAHYQPGAESYMMMSPRDSFGPVRVPEGKLFVMGDNRDRSYDSRFWGFVDHNDVEGRAVVIYWSWDGEEAWPLPVRWRRFGGMVR